MKRFASVAKILVKTSRWRSVFDDHRSHDWSLQPISKTPFLQHLPGACHLAARPSHFNRGIEVETMVEQLIGLSVSLVVTVLLIRKRHVNSAFTQKPG